MSATEVFASTIVFVWILFVTVLFAFHRFVMTNKNTASRGATPEELEAAIRRIYEDRLNEFRARSAAYHSLDPSMTVAHTALGVPPTATQEEIKAAYRRLAMRHHPDRGGDADVFQKVQAAYEQLMKPSRCPQCEGKGTIRVKRGAFVDKVQCPRCWPTKEGEK